MVEWTVVNWVVYLVDTTASLWAENWVAYSVCSMVETLVGYLVVMLAE